MEEQQYMARAIALAKQGLGAVNPNPLVGAVVVKDGKIIAEGYHACYGQWHAERNALAHCAEDCSGATLYVTLEPCCHQGKTPPCTDIIIEKKIGRVVVGIMDPNPLVAGKGIAILRKAGITVEVGMLDKEIRKMNRVFLKYITTQRPWVLLKTAMTLDGKIATRSGNSQWVTGEQSRAYVHRLRAIYPAIMVGIGTVLADNPMLNVRLDEVCRQPIRIVVDSNLRIPVDSRLVETAKEYRTVVVYVDAVEKEKLLALEAAGVELIQCPADEYGKVDVDTMLSLLAARKIDALLLEGGGTLSDAFLRAHAVDEIYSFIAPKLVGGAEAKTPVEGIGVNTMDEAIAIKDINVRMIGEDILVTGLIKY